MMTEIFEKSQLKFIFLNKRDIQIIFLQIWIWIIYSISQDDNIIVKLILLISLIKR